MHACACWWAAHTGLPGHTLIPSPLTSVRDSSKLMQSHTTSDCSAAILQICSGGGKSVGGGQGCV